MLPEAPRMLHTLIAEDEFTSRKILSNLLAPLGPCDIAMNGKEALEAFAGPCRKGPATTSSAWTSRCLVWTGTPCSERSVRWREPRGWVDWTA